MFYSACLLFSALVFSSSVCGDSLQGSLLFQNHRNITATAGQNVTLPCRATDGKSVGAVQWRRADLGSAYVLQYRNDHIDPEHQYPSFKNRVDLLDRQIKNGDVSLVLRNVTTDDKGTYECKIVLQLRNSRTQTVFINLDVLPPPDEPDGWTKDGRVALGVGLGVGLGLVLAFLLGIYFYRKRLRSKQSQQHAEELSERQEHLITQNGSAQQ